MCSTDHEYSAVWNERTIKARKVHQCDDCHRAIPHGERYTRIGSLFDGRWTTYRRHLGCVATADFIEELICGAHGEHGSILVGYLSEEIGNLGEYTTGKVSPEDAAELTDLGIEGVEVSEEDPEVYSIGYGAIAEWVWDLAKDHYPKYAEVKE